MKQTPSQPHVLVWGINYAPEETGIAPYNTDLCRFLRERGCRVTMVTSFPYYPQWRKRPEDRRRLFSREDDRGIAVRRCALYVPAKPTALRRMLHEASFVLTSFFRVLTLPRADVYVVISPPLLLGPAVRLLAFLKRRPYFLHIQDMQPDAAVQMGFLKDGALVRLLQRLESMAYKGARRVSGITEGMLQLFRSKGVSEERITFFPNWQISVSPQTEIPPTGGTFRRRYGIPRDALLLVYSGNLGRKQGLSILLDAAERLKTADAPVRIVIAGDGGEKPALTQRAGNGKLANVTFLPLLPAEEYRAMLSDADACLITQQKGSGALFFPSKLLNILSAGKPVVAVADADSELHRAVTDGGFGCCVPPEQPEELAEAMADLARDSSGLAAMSARGPEWLAQFSRDAVLGRFHQNLAAEAFPEWRIEEFPVAGNAPDNSKSYK